MDVAPNETLLSMDLVSNDALPLSFLPSPASSLPLLQPQPASVSTCLSLSLSLPQPQPQPASASASVCLQPRPQPQPASASACISLSLSLSLPQHQPASASACLSLSLLQPQPQSAFKMWPGNGVLGTRRTRSGLQLAPGIQNVAREWSSGNSKTTKWPTVGSGHSKCGPGMEFWQREERFCEDVPSDLRRRMPPRRTPRMPPRPP